MVPRWLPVIGKLAQARCVLGAALLAAFPAGQALAHDNGLAFRRPATLDIYVPQQDLELNAAVVDFLNGNDLPAAKRSSPPNAKPSSPQVAQPAPDKSVTSPRDPQATGKQQRQSPFIKWVAPKNSTDSSAAEQPTTEPAEPVQVALRPSFRRRAAARSQPATTRGAGISAGPKSPRGNHAPAVERVPIGDIPAPDTPSETAPEQIVTDLPETTLPGLSRSQKNLRAKIRRVLDYYYDRPMNTRDQSPWEVMHGILAYEVRSKVLVGGPRGKPVTAVGWLCFNQPCKRRNLMYVNRQDKLAVRVGPAMQGHRGQLLAMLAQSQVSRDYPMRVDRVDFTVNDLIRMEMDTCYPRVELTFKLIALMHYLDSDTTWVNEQGLQWSIPQLISEELRQPVRGSACGGTHRLAGLTLAYKTRAARGEPVDGEYLKARNFVRRYQQYAYRLQNKDGSFSTEWFRGPGNEQSLERKLKTTGHTLEWLLYAANEKQLQHWRTVKAVNYLATIMHNNRSQDWDSGILSHAIHALLLYDRLVFKPYEEAGSAPVATKPQRSTRTRRHR